MVQASLKVYMELVCTCSEASTCTATPVGHSAREREDCLGIITGPFDTSGMFQCCHGCPTENPCDTARTFQTTGNLSTRIPTCTNTCVRWKNKNVGVAIHVTPPHTHTLNGMAIGHNIMIPS